MPPTVTLSKDTFLAVPIVMDRPVFGNSDIIAIDEVHSFATSYSRCTRTIGFTFQEAADLARFLMYVSPAVDKLDKSLFAAFSAAVTAAVNLAVGATVTSSPVADVVMSALAPVSPFNVERNATSCTQFLSCCENQIHYLRKQYYLLHL